MLRATAREVPGRDVASGRFHRGGAAEGAERHRGAAAEDLSLAGGGAEAVVGLGAGWVGGGVAWGGGGRGIAMPNCLGEVEVVSSQPSNGSIKVQRNRLGSR